MTLISRRAKEAIEADDADEAKGPMIRQGCRFNEANHATADEAEMVDKPAKADEAEEADEANKADNTNEAIDAKEAEANETDTIKAKARVAEDEAVIGHGILAGKYLAEYRNSLK